MPNELEFENVTMQTLADKSKAVKVRIGGEFVEVNPDSQDGGSWPVAGIQPFGRRHKGWPEKMRVTMSSILKWEGRGLLSVEGREVVLSPAGPPSSPWKGSATTRKNHEFVIGSRIVFHNNVNDPNDDVAYKVVRNPGKFYDSDQVAVTRETLNRYEKESGNCQIHWDFLLEKE